ncbi:MAG TPA: energy transducer TonB [Candidatus Angelobacter sp.]|jgi:TonB family protein
MNAKRFLRAAIAVLCILKTGLDAQQQQARVPENIINQKVADALLEKRVLPDYSADVKSVNTSGQIVIAFTIDKTGKVTHAMVVDKDLAGRKSVNIGDPHLRQASLDAVKQWIYRPYKVNGQPREVDTSVVLVFNFNHTNGTPVKVGEAGDAVPTAKATMNVAAGNKTGEFGKPLIDPKVAESRLTGKTEPQYPQMAKIAKIQGNVVIHIVINKQGHVAKTKAESGHPILIQAAMDAVKNWDYQPFMLNGEPTEVETSVTVKFKP